MILSSHFAAGHTVVEAVTAATSAYRRRISNQPGFVGLHLEPDPEQAFLARILPFAQMINHERAAVGLPSDLDLPDTPQISKGANVVALSARRLCDNRSEVIGALIIAHGLRLCIVCDPAALDAARKGGDEANLLFELPVAPVDDPRADAWAEVLDTASCLDTQEIQSVVRGAVLACRMLTSEAAYDAEAGTTGRL